MKRTNERRPKRASSDVWKDIQNAYLIGGELRPLARRAGIPEGTVLARAAREGWSKQKRAAIESVRPSNQSAGTSLQSVAITRETLLETHLQSMLGICAKLSSYAGTLDPQDAFTAVRQIDTADKLTRRQLGLDQPVTPVQINLWSAESGLS